MGESFKVKLAIYDLSNGMAKSMSTAFLGKQIEAIYHTGILVYGKEFFFGSGIQQTSHEEFVQQGGNQPIEVLDLGSTEVPESLFQDFLKELEESYNIGTYDLIRNNCNNFSDTVTNFLVGKGIPSYILDLPGEVFSTPFGQMLRPMIENLQSQFHNPEHKMDALQQMGAALFGGPNTLPMTAPSTVPKADPCISTDGSPALLVSGHKHARQESPNHTSSANDSDTDRASLQTAITSGRKRQDSGRTHDTRDEENWESETAVDGKEDLALPLPASAGDNNNNNSNTPTATAAPPTVPDVSKDCQKQTTAGEEALQKKNGSGVAICS